MKIFTVLYAKMMRWARHHHAPYYLSVLSFAESSFFPIPPDVMLAPMALAKPHRALFYATLTTLSSVLGGLLGYLIGMFALHLIHPWIVQLGYDPMYQKIGEWFNDWGFWVMLLAGFTPIPYKLFTVAAGAAQIALFPFIMGSLIGRGSRFFLVSLLMRWGGERMERVLMQYVDRIAWVLIAVGVIAGGWYYFV